MAQGTKLGISWGKAHIRVVSANSADFIFLHGNHYRLSIPQSNVSSLIDRAVLELLCCISYTERMRSSAPAFASRTFFVLPVLLSKKNYINAPDYYRPSGFD